MDSIELNKIAAAVVCAIALCGGCMLAAQLLVPNNKPDHTEVPIPGLQQQAAPPGTGSAAAAGPTTAARGARLAAAQCGGCHSLQQGGGVQVGPPLWGIGGARVAANTAYPGYSQALRALGGDWTAARLDRWLLKPAAMAPSTAMGFPGIPDERDRADVVAFLVANGPNGKGAAR